MSNTTTVLVTMPGEELAARSISVATKLRESSINTDLYSTPEDSLKKQLKYAHKKKIPWVVIIFKDRIVLKNMISGKQDEVTIKELLLYVDEKDVEKE